MIAFIDDHLDIHGIEPICRVLPIAPSTCHVHAARQADPAKLSPRAKTDAALMIEIRRVFEAKRVRTVLVDSDAYLIWWKESGEGGLIGAFLP